MRSIPLALAATLVLTAQTPAHMPNSNGIVGVVCNTQEQAESVLITHRDHGWEAASAVYKQLRQTKDELGEPVCAYGQFEAELIQEISQFAGLEFPDRPSVTKDMVLHLVKVRSLQNGRYYFAILKEGLGAGA
jgi:hypothetical protein